MQRSSSYILVGDVVRPLKLPVTAVGSEHKIKTKGPFTISSIDMDTIMR